MSIKVSVIIPAYNAANTIASTLRSLIDQTFSDWEAIVVNDGSADHTTEIVKSLIEQEPRIYLISQENKGLSSARNTGIQFSHYDWLLFLDSDDWIFPRHLELLTTKLETDPSLDVVFCGWVYCLPDGEYVFPHFPEEFGDLFASFAQGCVSIVHTFIVRRTLVEANGKFYPFLQSCEDWALWQRIARSGARFGAVHQILAAYRTRPDSLTRNGYQLLKDGIQVLTYGHSTDPQSLGSNHPVYPNGLPSEGLTEQKFYLLCSCAGYLIGGGKSPNCLFDLLNEESCPNLNAYDIAHSLFVHASVAASRPRSEWHDLWIRIGHQGYLQNFLDLLERKSGTVGLSRATYKNLKILLNKYAKPQNIYQFLIQKYAEIILFKRSANYFFYKVKQFLKRNIWIGTLIFSQVRNVVRQVNHRMSANKLSKEHPIYNPQKYFENLFKHQTNPWDYSNVYEQKKYQQTLDMIPDEAKQDALELACAEGYFTEKLAPQVKSLLAVDISPTAIERCQQRCARFSNIKFQCFDFVRETIPGKFDLLVCSEVLYFLADRSSLKTIAEKLINALKPGGYLIMTHSNLLVDDPDSSGFCWDHAIGGKFIGEIFSGCSALSYIKELQTPLYRIQLFQRKEINNYRFGRKHAAKSVEIIDSLEYQSLPKEIADGVIIERATSLLILNYTGDILHNEAKPSIQPSLSAFEEQLRYLQKSGFYSIRVEEWGYAVMEKYPLKKQPIILLFEDCQESFLEYLWPLIQAYKFSATLCIYGSEIGKGKTFDPINKREISLIDWPQIRNLQAQGISFSAHAMNRQDLTRLSPQDAWYEIQSSRITLQNELATPIETFVYPYGKSNFVLEYLVGLAGYNFAIAGDTNLCKETKSLLRLSQVKVRTCDNLEDFTQKIHPYIY